MKRNIFFAAFLLGFLGNIAQVIFQRESLTLFYGNELTIGLMLSSWLFWVAIGSFWGAKLHKQKEDRVARVLLIMVVCSFLLTLILFRSVRIFLKMHVGESFTFLQIFAIVFLFQSFSPFLIGFTFTYLCKKIKTVEGAGAVYLFESLGSLLGGVIFTFYLVYKFDHFTVWIALLALSISYFSLENFINTQKIKFSRIFNFLLFLIISLSIFFVLANMKFGQFLNRRTNKWRWKNQEVIDIRDSPYANLVLTKVDNQYNIYSNSVLYLTIPNPIDDELIAHFTLLQHPNPKSVLLIGGGFGILREMLKHGVSKITYLELDREIINLAIPYITVEQQKVLEHQNVEIKYIDGRLFIKESEEKFDIIVINLFDPQNMMVNRFYTKEFFEEAKRKLNMPGVFCIGLISAENYFSPEILRLSTSIYLTLNSVFPYVIITPGDHSWLFASNVSGILTENVSILAERLRNKGINTAYFNEHFLSAILQPNRVKFVKNQLKRLSNIPLNLDFKPVVCFYNLLIWLEQSPTFVFQRLLNKFEELQLRKVSIIITLIILAVLLIRFIFSSFKERITSLTLVFSTGWINIGFTLILVYSFQAIYGYVYSWIGLIFALFMCGLAIGSWIGTKQLERNIFRVTKSQLSNLKTLLLIVDGTTCFLAFFLPTILSFTAKSVKLNLCVVEIPLLTFITGLLGGIKYPWSVKLYDGESKKLVQKETVGSAGGIIYGMDILGASFGAIITTVILIPTLGIFSATYLLGIIKISSLLLLISILYK